MRLATVWGMSLDGTWNITIKSSMGDQQAVAELKTNGAEFSGTYSTMGMNLDVTEGVIDGDSARWVAEITKPISIVSRFTVTFTDDTMTGEVVAGTFGTHQIVGTRQ